MIFSTVAFFQKKMLCYSKDNFQNAMIRKKMLCYLEDKKLSLRAQIVRHGCVFLTYRARMSCPACRTPSKKIPRLSSCPEAQLGEGREWPYGLFSSERNWLKNCQKFAGGKNNHSLNFQLDTFLVTVIDIFQGAYEKVKAMRR